MTLEVDRQELERLGDAVERLVASVPEAQRTLLSFEDRALRPGDDFCNPAELLVAAALVNQNRYKNVVIPRLQQFRSKYAHIDSIARLHQLVDSMDDGDICTSVLNFGQGKNPKNYRPRLLRGLAKAFDEYAQKFRQRNSNATDYEILRCWAREKEPKAALEQSGRDIEGLGPKLISWLQMYGGDFPTVPADVYTIEGMEKLGLGDTGKTAEFLARLFRISPYVLDTAFRTATSDPGSTRPETVA